MSASNTLTDFHHRRQSEALIAELKSFRPRLEDQSILDLVATMLGKCRTTLVLGAGVSKSVGVPVWGELINDLIDSICNELSDSQALAVSLKAVIEKMPSTVVARYLETIVLTKSALAAHLRKCLYKKYDDSKESRQLTPIVQLLLNPSLPSRVSHVLTYNFDNSLERCLTRHKLNYISVHNPETFASKQTGLRIYHPHGLLPHSENDPQGDYLDAAQIFSERAYNSLFMDMPHWANTLQLHHFETRFCLFIGLSMTDPSIRRLLEFARKHRGKDETNHVTIQRQNSDMLANALLEREMRSLGVRVLWIEKFERVPELLQLIQSNRAGTL